MFFLSISSNSCRKIANCPSCVQLNISSWRHVGENTNLRILNPLNAELNPICHLLALLGGATIVVVTRLRVNLGIEMGWLVSFKLRPLYPQGIRTRYTFHHHVSREGINCFIITAMWSSVLAPCSLMGGYQGWCRRCCYPCYNPECMGIKNQNKRPLF